MPPPKPLPAHAPAPPVRPQASHWSSQEGRGDVDGRIKGDGFYGSLLRPDGAHSTELSIGVPIDGRETEIPTMVPGLTIGELLGLLSQPDDAEIPESVVIKAVEHAQARMRAGKSPFAQPGEQDMGLLPQFARYREFK